MEIPNLTLAFQVLELKKTLEGAYVNKIQELPNSWLKIKLHTSEGTKDLIVSKQAIFLTSFKLEAKMHSTGFSAFLKKHLLNKRVLSIEQHGFDRIVLLKFENFYLIFELFAKGNVILTDKEFQILSTLRRETWKDRELKKGASYKFPSSKGLNPAKVSLKELKEIFSKKKEKAVVALIKEVNIAPVFAEEVFAKAKVKKEKQAGKLTEKEVKKILKNLKFFYGKTNLKKLKPVLIKIKSAEVLLPFELSSLKDAPSTFFPSLNEAFDEIFSKEVVSKKQLEAEKKVLKNVIALKKSLEQQRDALKKFERLAEENRLKGELIYKHYQEIRGLMEAIQKAMEKKIEEKEVMYKLKIASKIFKKMDLKNQKLVLNLEDKE